MSEIEQKIVKNIKYLQSRPNLKPTPAVNIAFQEIVHLACNYEASFTVDFHKHLQVINNICGQGEFELEKYWASKIVASSKNLWNLLRLHPYFSNYRDMVTVEYLAIAKSLHRPKFNMLFIGSGPLPMTAIMMAFLYNIKVTCLDYDSKAVSLSKELIDKLNLGDNIKIDHADALEFQGYKNYDVIFVAAMVGNSPEQKKQIINHVTNEMHSNSVLALRSVHGGRRILYCPIQNQDLHNLNVEIEIRPKNHIVNSLLVAKKKTIGNNIKFFLSQLNKNSKVNALMNELRAIGSVDLFNDLKQVIYIK